VNVSLKICSGVASVLGRVKTACGSISKSLIGGKATSVLGDLSVSYSSVSKPLSSWLEVCCVSLDMAFTALEKRSVYEGIFRSPPGEMVIGPLFGTLSAFAKLASVYAAGTNFGGTLIGFSAILKKVELAAKIFDAAKSICGAMESGSVRDKTSSLAKCISACLLLLAQMWIASSGLGIVGAAMYTGVTTLLFKKIDSVLFKLDRQCSLSLDAALSVFSETKLPNRLAQPVIDFFAPQHL
jgi:hypothetical protein